MATDNDSDDSTTDGSTADRATADGAAAQVVDSLTASAGVHPDKLALVVDEDLSGGLQIRWSYRQLESHANRLARGLRELGMGPGDMLLWCSKNSAPVVALVHAARKLGLTAVPLNYRLSADEAAYVVANSDATVAFIDAEFVPLFEGVRERVPGLGTIIVSGGPAGKGMIAAEDLIESVGDEALAPPAAQARTMIYTSGTTGKPKGAVRTGQGNPQQLMAMVEHIGYGRDEVYLTTGPLYHSGPGGFMGIAFLLGHTIVVQKNFDEEDWLRLVSTHRVTSTFAAPTPIRRICNLPDEIKERYDTSSLKFMIANAAPWPFPLKLAYLADFPEDSLFEVYGSTELGVNMILRPEDQLRKPGSCGRPSPRVEVRLLDDNGVEVTRPHTPGEIFVRSLSVFDDYHKARDKYEEDRRGDFHTVGDIATFDEEGFFFICDRKKDMIISGGMNIYPAEIESVLEGHPSIFEAAVFGVPSDQWGESVHAVVVLKPDGQSFDELQVMAYARAHLAGYKVPRSVSFVAELPKTGSGKILKRDLRAPFWEGSGRTL